MGLKEKLTTDLQQAQKRGDKSRMSALRLIKAGIKNAEIDKGAPLDDAAVIDVIAREVKQRRESIDAYKKGNRAELVEKEELELAIVLEYMPEQMSRDAVMSLTRNVVAEVGARGPGDKGKVMSKLMPQMKGKADGREVGGIVDEILSSM